MNLKMLALSAQGDAGTSKMLARISGAFSGFADETEFAVYDSLKTLLPPFAEALKTSQGIVLAIQKSKYNNVRAKLCAALALETAEDKRLYDLISKKSDAEEEVMHKHAVVPKGAAIFASGDGMYPGFAVKKGKQIIFFLPLDSERLDGELKGGVVPFLMQQSAKKPAEPEKKPDKVLPQPTDPFADSVLQRTINILRENNQTVAVSSTPTSSYIKALATKNTVDFDRFFIFTPHVEDKGDYNLTDYAALLAKSAKELAGAPYGACISEICTSDGGDSVYITVADEKTALVRKLYREDDETTEAFLHDAAEELVELIGEKAAGKGAVGIEVASVDTNEKKGGFLSKKSGKITVSIIAIVLVAAIVTGSIFFVREKRAREALAAEEASRQAAEAATATSATTTEIAKPVVDTVPLSQFIYNEAVNGITETPAEVTTASADGSAIDTSNTAPAATSTIPDTIIVNGETLDAKEAVARMVEAEMDNTYNEEAIKAQAVVVYTYLKYRNTNWKITGVTLADEYSDEVYNAVRAVFGEYLSFNNAPAFTPFFKLSAGKTVAAETVFGKSYPYLRAVDSLSDRTQEGYKTDLIFSSADVKALLTAYDETLTLGDDPNEWIKVTAHSGAVNTGVGYVQTVSVGGKEISGMEFVNKVMAGKNMPSECFSVEYNTPTDEFTFTVYGIGHGVGMSQMGADKMAATGSTYVQILSKYYSGTTLTA